jgi:hypothetical protein
LRSPAGSWSSPRGSSPTRPGTSARPGRATPGDTRSAGAGSRPASTDAARASAPAMPQRPRSRALVVGVGPGSVLPVSRVAGRRPPWRHQRGPAPPGLRSGRA